MNLRETSVAPGPTAVLAEDEALLADELADLLHKLWPQLRIVARAGDGVAALHAIAAALVDHLDLVLRCVDDGTSVDRHDPPFNRATRRARGITQQFAGRLRQQSVADAHFFLGGDDVDGGRNDLGVFPSVLVGDRLRGLAAHQQRLADVLCLVAQHFAGAGVLQWCCAAEDAEFKLFARCIEQRRAGLAARVGAVSARQEDPTVLRGHDAGRILQAELVHDHRLGQEWFDQLRLDRGIPRVQLHGP